MMSRLAQAKAWTGGKDPTFSAARMVCSLPAAPMIGAALGWGPLADSG